MCGSANLPAKYQLRSQPLREDGLTSGIKKAPPGKSGALAMVVSKQVTARLAISLAASKSVKGMVGPFLSLLYIVVLAKSIINFLF